MKNAKAAKIFTDVPNIFRMAVGGMMSEFITWLRGMLADGTSPSFGRSGAGFIIYFLVVWGCYIVSKTAVIPDIPYGWITVIGMLYGITGAKEAYIKGKEAINGVVNPAVEQ